MRIAWVAALLVLAGCSTPASQPAPVAGRESSPFVPCTDPRPQLCTREYAPACASMVAGGFRTYASGCSACSDPAVSGYQEGACIE